MQSLRVDVLAELTKISIPFHYGSSAEWVTILCPFHDEKTPSCGVNLTDQYFKCQGCGAGGDMAKLVARRLSVPKYVVWADFEARYGATKDDKPVENDLVEKCHARIWVALPLVEQLARRGITHDLIRQYRLGEWGGKITIPIANSNGVWVNVMKYTPGAASGKKFDSLRGRGAPRLYPIEQLKYESVLFCGGPLKAVAAAAELNQYGIGAIANTTGESVKNFPPSFFGLLSGKKWLGVCLDVDTTGRSNAEQLANRFTRICDTVCKIDLPLDRDKYPHGDISDWIGQERKTVKPLIDAAPQWQYSGDAAKHKIDDEATKVSLTDACQATNANKRIEFRALVTAIEQESFYLPKNVAVLCDRKQDLCGVCPIWHETAVKPVVTISPESENLLAMTGANRRVQSETIRTALGIPPCKVVDFEIADYYQVNQAILAKDLDAIDNTDSGSELSAVSVDADIQLNETYDVTGRVVPHPNTQRATAIISSRSTVVDTLSAYQLKPDTLEKFQVRIDGVAGIHEKLTVIYQELSKFVTRIYERQELHLFMDLAFHSCLYFRDPSANGKVVKGWVEALAVGDSSQGKSETAENLIKHYGLGRFISCKNASVAGLLGGVQKIGERFFVSWGLIPASDRRLVVLEELKGANPEIIAKLTDMRSSGIAEIPKIERKKTHARTRLIALSNTRSGRTVDTYSYGVDAIRELVPNLEDIRRFDIFTVISGNEVPVEITANTRTGEDNESKTNGIIPLVFDSLSCRALVLWAWTRTQDQVQFESWPHLLAVTKKLCEEFSDNVPIIDRGGARYKIARLAVALACRLFSHLPESCEVVYVRTSHVDYIASFLRKLYTTKAFGYDRFSQAVADQNTMRGEDQIVRRIVDTPYPADLIECLLRASNIEIRDICDWCGWDRLEATNLVSLLVRNHALVRDGRGYKKNPSFIAVLQKLASDTELQDRLAAKLVPPKYTQGF